MLFHNYLTATPKITFTSPNDFFCYFILNSTRNKFHWSNKNTALISQIHVQYNSTPSTSRISTNPYTTQTSLIHINRLHTFFFFFFYFFLLFIYNTSTTYKMLLNTTYSAYTTYNTVLITFLHRKKKRKLQLQLLTTNNLN